jgi:hypothetical protein
MSVYLSDFSAGAFCRIDLCLHNVYGKAFFVECKHGTHEPIVYDKGTYVPVIYGHPNVVHPSLINKG